MSPGHRKVHAVATVDRETEFPQTQPGKRRPIAFSHPRVCGAFDAELRGPDKGPLHVAEGFQDRLGIAQRNTRAEDQYIRETSAGGGASPGRAGAARTDRGSPVPRSRRGSPPS